MGASCYWSTASIWMGALALKSQTKPSNLKILDVPWLCLTLTTKTSCKWHLEVPVSFPNWKRVWMWRKEILVGDCTNVSVRQQICTRLNWTCLWGARCSVPRKGCKRASRDRQQRGIFDLPHPQSSVELSSFQGFLWLYGFLTLPATASYFCFYLNSSLKASKGIPCYWVVIVV